MLVLVSFVTTPLHFFADPRSSLQEVLLIGSELIFLFGLMVGVFRTPRAWRLVAYALVAGLTHGALSWVT